MRRWRLLAVAVTAGLIAGVVAASNAPLSPHATGGALLRLAWSARPERLEECRSQSAEELARLPPHMRQPVVCEGVTARYRLTATHAGRVLADRIVSAGGLRQDRRLYVLEDLPVAAGEALVEVQFTRIEAAPAATAPAPDRLGQNRRGQTVPARLTFAACRTIEAHTVLLITYDPEQRVLVARSPSSASK
jgi:hypothetical protein